MPRKLVFLLAISFFALPLILLLWPVSLQAADQNFVTLDPAQQKYNLSPYVEILKDPSRELDIHDITSPEYSRHFQPHEDRRAPSYSYTGAAVWVRFWIQDNHPTGNSQWLLQLGYPLLNRIDFYIPGSAGEYRHRQAGASFPFPVREIEHRNFVFSIPSSWEEEQPFLLRVETQSAMVLPLTLWEAKRFMAHTEQEYLSLGLYYGILLIIIFYTLFLFIYVQAKNYFYYVFFITSAGLFHLIYNGLAFQYLWPHHPWWGQNALNFFIFTGCFSALLFARHIMPIREHAPVLEKLLKVLLIYTACMIPLTLVLNFTLAMQLGIAGALATVLIILPAALICWYRRYRPARYLLLGWVFLGVGVLLMSGRSLGYLPDTFTTMYGTQLGFTAKVIFLFLGLADHMYIVQEEKEQVKERNEKLEMEKQKLLQAETLNALSREISISDEINSIAQKLLIYIKKLIPYHRACFLANKNGEFHVLACEEETSTAGAGKEKYEGRLPAENIFHKVLQTKKPLLIPDLKETNPLQAYPVQQDSSSAMLVPLFSQGKQLGVVVLESKKSRAYSKLDFSLVMNFAAQAGLAMENARLFQEINMLAITDDLTGIYNRRHFYQLGEKEFLRARRYNLPLSLIMMDIDYFKKINDSLGHAAGDEVLQKTARQCLKNLRNADIACRYGGEEFAFLLPETSLEKAWITAERLRDAISSTSFAIKKNDQAAATASFGVSTLEKDMLNFDQMIDRADTALYEAKKKGRNMVVSSSS